MNRMHRTIGFGILAVTVVLGINACTPKMQPTTPVAMGPQTLTGSLSPVELSLTRRGTHILRQNGNDLVYVESTMVNLRSFEGMDVSVKGTVEANTDASQLPVLVATRVTLVEEPSHPWTVPALHMQFSAPLSWNGDVFDDGIRFSETGSSVALLKIIRSSLSQLPVGTPLVVGGQRATRTASASGQVVYVQNGPDIIAIVLDKSLSDAQNKQPVQSVLRLLTSIVFTNVSSTPAGSGSLQHAGTGAMTGTPCGGTAGVLCPSGNYCAITDPKLGIGVCRPFMTP